jgi:demethylmenaquinone methyltransferase/2-methoxy-6-polyprenyl-1,4-benzoquinol methylase
MIDSPPKASEIKAIFNKIAPVYDQMNNWLSLGIHRIWKLMAVKWSEPAPNDIGLDLCCGSGDLTFLLANQISQGKVYGVDFSAQLLKIARQKSKTKYFSSEIEWIEADVLNLPFQDNYFDCATMGYGLRNVIDIPLCFKELHRVLKPQAKAAILDFHRPSDEIINNFQKWYLENIVVSSAVNFGVQAEYAYILPSLERFPRGDEQVTLAQIAGFSHSLHYPLFGGIMGALIVSK